MALVKDVAITDDSDILRFTYEIYLAELLEDTEGAFSDFGELHKLAVNEIINWLLVQGIKVADVKNPEDFQRAAIYHLCSVVFLGASQNEEDTYWAKHARYAGLFGREMMSQLVQLEAGEAKPLQRRKLVIRNRDTNAYFTGDSFPNEEPC